MTVRSVVALGLTLALSSCSIGEHSSTQHTSSGGSVHKLQFMTATTSTAGDLTEHPGQVALPQTLTERTVVSGAAPTVSSSTGLIGSVVDVIGTPVNGVCRTASIRVESISPGSVLRDDFAVPMTASSQIHYDDVVEKQKGTEVGYLGFSAGLGSEDRAEVLIEDVAEQSIENFNTATDSTRLKSYEAKPLPSGACGRYVITRLVLTAIKYRVFTKKEQKAAIAAILNIGGHKYYTHTKQVNDLILGVVLRPIGYLTPDKTPRESVAPPTEVRFLP